MGTALLVAFVPLALAAPAGAAQLPIPDAFSLAASNGYSVFVDGVPARAGHPAVVVMTVSRKEASVTYASGTGVEVSEGAIRASFGQVGEVDVHFIPSGEPRSETSSCGGKPVVFDSGSYEGTIVFHGEEGFAHAVATRAQGDVQFLLDAICPSLEGESSGPHVPGAELVARTRPGGTGFSLRLDKNRPGAPTRYDASVRETRGSVWISRDIQGWTAPGAFDYEQSLRTAVVRPPPPFAGRAVFHRGSGPNNRWAGSLSADFPGRAGAPLTGVPMRVGLQRHEYDGSPPE